jgi:hypothetical protein
MLNLFIGALVIGLVWFLVYYVTKKNIKIAWWQWLLTALGLIYLGFLVSSVGILLGEGTPKAALVIGGIFGLVAVIWGVLMGRFVFLRKAK